MEKTIKKIEKLKMDPHSPIPLYHQTYLMLRDFIHTQKLKPGEMIPPETTLASALNVGRQTVRTAMSQLVEDGLVERFPGRGTFVCEKERKADFLLDRSFSQEMEESGKKPSSQVLHLSVKTINDKSPKCFSDKIGVPCLFLTRLRFGDGIPIGLQEAIILTERCPGLEKYDFNTASLYRILTEEYGLEISEIYHIVNAVLASRKYAELLEINVGAPLLLEKSITYLADGEPIEATTSYFRVDRHEYSVRFRYRGSKRI